MHTIRRAHTNDRDPVLALIEAFCRIDSHPFTESRVAAALEPLLVDDRYGQVWLAVDDGDQTLLGYAVVTWGWSLESGGLDCILDEIYVERRSVGLGAELVERVKIEAARHGALVMALETEAPNEAARRFYRRHGFADEDSTWMVSPLGGGTSN